MAITASVDDTEKYLPFLLEIRRRLFITVLLFVTVSAIGFVFYEKIIRFVLDIFQFEGVNVVFTSPFQFINLAIQSSLIVGLIVIFPVIVFQIISFVKPALSPREFKTLLLMIPAVLGLFIAGFSYGMLVMRYVVVIFYHKSLELEIGNLLDVSSFISQILLTALLLGVAFQFPLIITFLIRANFVSKNFFSNKRAIAYALSLIFAALLPPTDLLSLILLFAPLIGLFEATIALNKYFSKNKKN